MEERGFRGKKQKSTPPKKEKPDRTFSCCVSLRSVRLEEGERRKKNKQKQKWTKQELVGETALKNLKSILNLKQGAQRRLKIFPL